MSEAELSPIDSQEELHQAARQLQRNQTMQTLTPSKKKEMKEIFNLFDMVN